MIGYVTLGTNDLARGSAFYDELLAVIGAGRMMETEQFIAWSMPDHPGAAMSITLPWDGEPATVGNGVMAAIQLDTPEQVDALHARALALGATDEGAPGPRGEGFYAGYFRDLDGNKLNAFVMG